MIENEGRFEQQVEQQVDNSDQEDMISTLYVLVEIVSCLLKMAWFHYLRICCGLIFRDSALSGRFFVEIDRVQAYTKWIAGIKVEKETCFKDFVQSCACFAFGFGRENS